MSVCYATARGWTGDRVLAAVVVARDLSRLLQPRGARTAARSICRDYCVTLVGKIMCYAIVALAMDLIWGYAGILSLGHGLFFALGGYAMGMYLMRAIGRDGEYQSELPDFMVFLDWKAYPWYWSLHRPFLVCVAAGGAGAGDCSRSCSAISRSARASRACISRSSRRR